MPTVFSKETLNKDKNNVQTTSGSAIDTDKVLKSLGAPEKCSSCSISCDHCMLSCKCYRCALRKNIDGPTADRARIATLKSHQKLMHMDSKQKQKIIYGEFKQCIAKVSW
jgi:hypothetical protein